MEYGQNGRGDAVSFAGRARVRDAAAETHRAAPVGVAAGPDGVPAAPGTRDRPASCNRRVRNANGYP